MARDLYNTFVNPIIAPQIDPKSFEWCLNETNMVWIEAVMPNCYVRSLKEISRIVISSWSHCEKTGLVLGLIHILRGLKKYSTLLENMLLRPPHHLWTALDPTQCGGLHILHAVKFWIIKGGWFYQMVIICYWFQYDMHIIIVMSYSIIAS